MLLTAPLVLTLLSPAPAELEAKVQSIFDDKCTSCHDDGDDLVLAGSLAPLLKLKGETGKPMVVPGKPGESYLMAKLVGKDIEGDPMPMGDDPLPKSEMDDVKAWIVSLAPPAAEPAAEPKAAAKAPVVPAGPSSAELEPKLLALFDDKCNMCHDEGADEVVLAGSLAHLTKTNGATDKPFIVAGDVEGSYLWSKLVASSDMKGEQMPMGDDPLPAEELDLVKEYIAALGREAAAAAAPPTEGPAEVGGSVEVGTDTPPPVPEEDDEAPAKRGKQPFHGTFQHNLPTTGTLGKRKFEFRMDHRFGRIGTERGAFGLDAGVVMSAGFAYGIMDGWDVLLRRSNSRKGYELGTKFIAIRQENGAPLSLGGYTSIEYYRDYDTNTANPVSGNFQAMLSRLWFERWSTMLLVGYYLRTNHAANITVDFDDGAGPVAAKDTRNTLNVGLASSVWLGKRKRWGVDMEYIFPIPADVFHYNGDKSDPNGANIGSWSLGGSYSSGLHFFQIFFANTREIHTNLYAPGGQTKNPFENRGNFFLGFNLSRKWTIKERKNRKTKKEAK